MNDMIWRLPCARDVVDLVIVLERYLSTNFRHLYLYYLLCTCRRRHLK